VSESDHVADTHTDRRPPHTVVSVTQYKNTVHTLNKD